MLQFVSSKTLQMFYRRESSTLRKSYLGKGVGQSLLRKRHMQIPVECWKCRWPYVTPKCWERNDENYKEKLVLREKCFRFFGIKNGRKKKWKFTEVIYHYLLLLCSHVPAATSACGAVKHTDFDGAVRAQILNWLDAIASQNATIAHTIPHTRSVSLM